jgi:hypothetical protein
MAIEAIVDSLDAVPEDLRGDYVEKDGKYMLKALEGFVPGDQVEDVTGLKSALQKERENAREAQRKYRQMQEQYSGYDVEELQQLREAQAKAEEDRAKKAGEWDSLKTQLVTKHNDEKSAWEKEKAELMNAFSNQLRETAALQAISENKGNTALLKPHVLAALKVERDESGKFVTHVVDDAGGARMNSDGKYLSVSDYVKDLRDQETFAGAFLGTGSSGGGTPPGGGDKGGAGGKGGIPSDLKRGGMTPKQKVDFINEYGHDEFMKLPV